MATHSSAVQQQGQPSPSLDDFEAIYAAEFAFVWRVLRRFGVEPWQLEDAVHDVFLVWVRRRGDFGRGAAVRTCLYGIARRVAADTRRAARRAQRRRDALASVLVDRDDSVERTLETQHALGLVDRALGELSDVQREVYLLAEVEGLSAQQIGAALSISPNTASSRLRLARQRLAAALGETRLPREEPPADARNRVWAALLPLGSLHHTTPPATAATAGTTPYFVATALLGAALSLFALFPRVPPDPPGSPAPGARATPSSGASEAPPAALPTASLPAALPTAALPTASLPAAALPTASLPAAALPAAALPAASLPAPAPAARPAHAIAPVPADMPPATLSSGPVPASMPPGAPALRAPATAAARPPRRPAPSQRPVPSDMSTAPAPASAPPEADLEREDPLAREARLIAQAQRHLKGGRLDAALAALDAHAADAPNGRLADERETLRAAARCRRGDRDALAAAERWFAGRPDASALATARALCRPEETRPDE